MATDSSFVKEQKTWTSRGRSDYTDPMAIPSPTSCVLLVDLLAKLTHQPVGMQHMIVVHEGSLCSHMFPEQPNIIFLFWVVFPTRSQFLTEIDISYSEVLANAAAQDELFADASVGVCSAAEHNKQLMVSLPGIHRQLGSLPHLQAGSSVPLVNLKPLWSWIRSALNPAADEYKWGFP